MRCRGLRKGGGDSEEGFSQELCFCRSESEQFSCLYKVK